LYDEKDSITGEFSAAVTGQRLSLSFYTSRYSGVTCDYQILDAASFSRSGEM
jgi:hypothetical protein